LEALEAPVSQKDEETFSKYIEDELKRAQERADALNAANSNPNLHGSSQDLSPASIASPNSVQSLHIGFAAKSIFVNPDGSR
jgi:hypothetical protein